MLCTGPQELEKAEDAVSATSLESVVINDLLLQEGWQTFAHWWWSKPGHINILQSRAFVGLERRLLDLGGDRRFTALLDSRVAKGAHAKGRSSSRALRPSLLRSCSYQIAGNIYPSFGFAPTRINTADAPSHDRDFPEAADHSLISALTPEQISSLHSRQFSRANANWIRLCLLVFICLCPGVSAATVDRHSSCTPPGFGILLASLVFGLCIFSISRLPHSSVGLSHDFSATWTSVKGAPWKPSHPQSFWVGTSHCHVIAVWAALHLPPAHAMPMHPANKDEACRAERRAGNASQADRVVLQSTRNRRDHLLIAFDRWLNEHLRTTLEEILAPASLVFEFISEALVAYGKALYESGKAYSRYAETINAITARRPGLRRNVAACWDLAFNWIVDEPHEHNKAIPQSILVALVGLALLWGWSREAALFAMGWAGVLRIGEIFSARREDLILPRDAAPGVWFALLKIRLPKTRGRAARHQSSRIDPEDVVALLDAVFAHLLPSEPLWNKSPSALRKKFSMLQAALGLDGGKKGDDPPYSLASLRPGGATYWLQTTEDAEL